MRRRSSERRISPFSSRFEMSVSASLPKRFLPSTATPGVGVQHAVEALREGELLGVGERLVAEHEDGVLVHPGADLVQRLAIVNAPQVDRPDLGDEVRVQPAEGQWHRPSPPGDRLRPCQSSKFTPPYPTPPRRRHPVERRGAHSPLPDARLAASARRAAGGARTCPYRHVGQLGANQAQMHLRVDVLRSAQAPRRSACRAPPPRCG